MALLAVGIAAGATASHAESPASVAPQADARDRRPRYQEYRVAAGIYLPLELRTRLSSNANTPGDAVTATLVRPLTAGDVELVPAGATVLGTITEAERAGKKRRGRLTFTFHVIEHPETGSRATIRGSVLRFASEPPVKGNVYPELLLEKGLDVSVLLVEPLSVRIPVEIRKT